MNLRGLVARDLDIIIDDLYTRAFTLGMAIKKRLTCAVRSRGHKDEPAGRVIVKLLNLEKWVEFQEEQDGAQVPKYHIHDYLSYLLTYYEPKCIIGNNEVKRFSRTTRSISTILFAFFH